MAGIASAANVGAGVSGARSSGSDTKDAPKTSNTASAASVKAASPTTAVRSDTRDTSTPTRTNTAAMVSGSSDTGTKSSSNGIAAAANVGAGVSSSSGSSSRTSTADRVDQAEAPAWLQLQDQLDALTPGIARGTSQPQAARNAMLTATSDPGMGTDWSTFAGNVNNGSLGQPGANGYGLDYNPDAPQPNIFQNGLQAVHDFLQGPYERRVAENGGVAPFQGPIDTAGIYAALQKPYLDRVAREEAADRVASAPVTREVQTIPIRVAEAAPSTADSGWSSAWSKLLNDSDRLPADPLNLDAAVPAYAPDAKVTARTVNPDGSYSDPLEAIQAATAADVPLPRRDPRGYDDLFSTDGQVSTPDGTIITPGRKAPVAITVHGGATEDKPSTWDKVVDNTGKLLSHTGLGSLVSTMFPDLWNGMGDTFKGIDNGGGVKTKYPDDMAAALAGMYGDPHSGQNNSPIDFIDLNHNGIDDRLEGYTPPAQTPTGTPGISPPDLGGDQFRSNRQAVFPDMPPYRPGFDDEWNYFHDHLARGGVVGYADRDPRVSMIADAEDALHRGDHQHESITRFVDSFGPKALENLNNNVRAGYRMRAGRVVSGPGGPTDDAVPAVIDGQHPARLSSGEFIVPVNAVEGIGDGDPKVGADRLHALVERFAQKGSA